MKQYTHIDKAEMLQLACNHSDAVPDEPCPDCGYTEEEILDSIALEDK